MAETSKDTLIERMSSRAVPLFLMRKYVLKRLLPYHLLEDVTLDISKERGIDYTVVDPAHVSTRRIKVKPVGDFEVLEDRKIALELDVVYELINHAQDQDWILVGIGREDPSLLWFAYKDVIRFRKMPALDADLTRPPTIEFEVVISVSVADLRYAVFELEKTGGHCVIYINDGDGLVLEGPGTVGVEGTEVYPSFNVTYHKHNFYSVRTILSLDYLREYLKSLHDTETLYIHLRSDYPVGFETHPYLGDDTYLQAPRIEDSAHPFKR